MTDSHIISVWIKPQIKSLQICCTYDLPTCQGAGKVLGNTDTVSSVSCAS